MKQCPQCSTKNPSESKFCNGCGANLEGIEPISEATSDTLKKPSGKGKNKTVITCVILFLVVLIGIFWYSSTHCKASGCDEKPYSDGYCKYHYAEMIARTKYNQSFGRPQ